MPKTPAHAPVCSTITVPALIALVIALVLSVPAFSSMISPDAVDSGAHSSSATAAESSRALPAPQEAPAQAKGRPSYASWTYRSPVLDTVVDVAPVPPTGVRLPSGARPIRYAIELALSPESESFSGTADIEIEIAAALPLLWLNASHLTLGDASFRIGGEVLRPRIVTGGANLVGFAFGRPVGPGRATLHVAYTGLAKSKESSGLFRQQERGDWYLYSQFESIEARWAFPCFDEPSFKVPWQFTLRVRKDLVAVSNTPIVSESEAPDGMKVVRFAETKPLPSYLLAFGVGPFDVVEGPPLGSKRAPFRILVPKGQKGAGTDYAVKVTPEFVGLLEKYFGSPYPYEKLDLLAVPLFPGAMENAALITYGRSLLLAKREDETLGRQRIFARIHAHELAHMWFGDLVTLEWWDDTWLNESFADWMADKILGQWRPEWGGAVQRIQERSRAMATDSLITARRIRQPIESENDIENAFDAITYSKGASVLSMFERWIGQDRFQKGVQRYLEAHAFGNATADDFLSALAADDTADLAAPGASGKVIVPDSPDPHAARSIEDRSKMVPAIKSFLDQGGVPLVTATLSCPGVMAAGSGMPQRAGGSTPRIRLSQKRYLPSGSKGSTDEIWRIPVCVRYGSGDDTANARARQRGVRRNGKGQGRAGSARDDSAAVSGEECTLLAAASGEITLEKAGTCPDWFLPNAGAAGYYRSKIESETSSGAPSPSTILTRLFDDGGRRLTLPERLGAFDDLKALALAGQTPIGDVLALIPELLRDGSRHTLMATTRLVESMRPHLVPDEMIPNYQRFIRATYGARARELGLVPKKGEPDEVRLARPGLISLVTVCGEDRRLQEQARVLALQWLDDPRAIEPDMVDAVLEAAARHGDAALYERFLTAARSSTDRSLRRHFLGAMAAFQEPALVNKRLGLLLSEELDIRESLPMLWSSVDERAPREIAFDFVKKNYDALAARLPDRSEARLVRAGSEFCDESRRRDVEAFFKERTSKALGGPRLLAEALEGIDLCIATKKAQQTSIASFLRKY